MNKLGTTFGAKDIYIEMAEKILKNNPEYWSKKDKPSKVKHGFIYAKRNNVVVEIMSYRRFMKVIKKYFILARKRVTAGHTINLGSKLGRITPMTIARNFKNKVVNWKATKAKPKVPNEHGVLKRKMVYYTSDTYSRVKWEKYSKVPNQSVYTFDPCGGNGPGKGFKGEFSTALIQNPLLEKKFKQYKNDLQLG
jgi:hypothetical protein